MWLLIWTLLALHSCLVYCNDQLIPQSRTFASLQDLKDSTFWQNFMSTRNPIIANSTAIYINDTNTVFYFEEKIPQSRYKTWLGRKPPISMIEVSLGDEYHDTSIEYYPLYTISTELSTSGASMERELTHGFGITVSLDSRLKNGLLVVAITTGFSSQYALGFTLSQTMVCRAPKGGAVQMQVSSELRHFPQAKSRRVVYKDRTQQFENGDWEKIHSVVEGGRYDGLMFYWLSARSRQRCVTDRKFFKSANTSWLPKVPHLLKYKRDLQDEDTSPSR